MTHIVGYGSQGAAWARSLRASGWTVEVYLADPAGRSGIRAAADGFSCNPLSGLAQAVQRAPEGQRPLIPLLCPDSSIAGVYGDFLAPLGAPLTLVLAHGYAVYAGELKAARPEHDIALLAPKAIGPKLQAACESARPGAHRLVAGFHAPERSRESVSRLARGLGFAPERLVETTFEKEAVGDLISEQSLLCGGVFTLLEWTMEEMLAAGVPTALIREECLTELELIAGLLRERGPATTFRAISQAAQAGTIEMRERLESIGAREAVREQARRVTGGVFARAFRSGEWKAGADALAKRFEDWEQRLGTGVKE